VIFVEYISIENGPGWPGTMLAASVPTAQNTMRRLMLNPDSWNATEGSV